MIRVVIESPFAGTSSDPETWRMQTEDNLAYLRAAMADSLRQGEAPFASHALYTQPGVLDDTIPEQRTLGIEAGLLWGQVAHRTVVYIDRGVSIGMQLGINHALAQGHEVEFRTLPDWQEDLPAQQFRDALIRLGEIVSKVARRPR